MTGRPLLVNIVLFRLADDTLQVLLASPAQGWELPGSELNELEGLEQAAERAIATLLDRRKTYLEQLFTYGTDGHAAIRVVYFAIIPAEAHLVPGQPARWTALSPLPPVGVPTTLKSWLMPCAACVISSNTAPLASNSCRPN